MQLAFYANVESQISSSEQVSPSYSSPPPTSSSSPPPTHLLLSSTHLLLSSSSPPPPPTLLFSPTYPSLSFTFSFLLSFLGLVRSSKRRWRKSVEPRRRVSATRSRWTAAGAAPPLIPVQIRFMFEQLDSLRDRVEMLGESLRSEEVARASRSDDLLRWVCRSPGLSRKLMSSLPTGSGGSPLLVHLLVPRWRAQPSLQACEACEPEGGDWICAEPCQGEVCCAVSVLSSDNIRHSRDVSLRHTLPSQGSPSSLPDKHDDVYLQIAPLLTASLSSQSK
eukprot:768744-Hanusia_phi.AAC.11